MGKCRVAARGLRWPRFLSASRPAEAGEQGAAPASGGAARGQARRQGPGGRRVGPPESPLPARGTPVTSAPRSLGALSGSGDEPGPGCRASLPTLPLRKWCATLAGAEAEAAAALGELLFTGGVGRAAELSRATGPGERRQPSGRRPGLEPRSRAGLGTGGVS